MSAAPPRSRAALYATAAATGAAVMVVEILGTRIVGPVFGVSLFVWTALLSVTLCALAAGYYAGGALVDRRPTARLLGAVIASSGVLLGLAAPASRPVLQLASAFGPRIGPLAAAAVLFAPCLAALGMIGPIAVRLAADDVRATGHKVGSVYAVSTAGSLLGTLLVSFWLIPTFETNAILLGSASLLCLVGASWLAGRARMAALVLVAVVPLAGALGAERRLPAGLRILARAHSPYGLVEVVDDPGRGVRLLRADHSVIGAQFTADGSAAFGFLHVIEALRFLRPAARSALQIGLGIGSVPMALRPFGVESDVVDIDPAVVRLARQHFGFATRGAVHVEDARTFLLRTTRRYDLIIHDAFTGGASPEHLLSREVLARIRQVLRPGGVLALALPGYERGPLAGASFAVARTLRAVFPVVRAFRDGPPSAQPTLANLVFFAADAPLHFTIPGGARFENGSCRGLLTSFQRWEVLQQVPPGPVVTDAHNPLARLQLPVAEQHFLAMAELLPAAVWLP